MPNRNIQITNRKNLKLSAKLESPEGNCQAYAIFAHCFTCNKNLRAVRNISKALQNHNIAVLRFDFTGLGGSEGDFGETNFSSNMNDLVDISQYLTEYHEAPKLLIGHSLGGAAVIFASEIISSIQAVATIGAPSSPKHVQHLFSNKVADIKNDGMAIVNIGGRKFPISSEFLNDIESKDLPTTVKKIDKSLLVLHSPQDLIVGVENAAEIFTHAMHPKSFVSLDGADHLLSNRDDSTYVGNVIAQWASRYLK